MQENINIPDSNITTNLSFRQLVLMNMQQLTNFPYIEKDFDALTDYELLCLVVKFLNDVIANQNEQNASITRMYESFLALQTYVNNTKDSLEDAFNNLDNYVRYYFDNLDVQEEINNKLDQMLEDRVLTEIIQQFLQSTSIWCFDTVADMKAATNLIDGSYARTTGYYSINDGGGSLYKITDTVDLNEHQEELNSGLYATLIHNNYIDIKQLGANNTDISSIMIEAINKYNNIYINGNYTTDDTILISDVNNKKLIFNGSIYAESSETNEKPVFEFRDSSNITIENLVLSSTRNQYESAPTGHTKQNYDGSNRVGFRLKHVSNFYLNNSNFSNLQFDIFASENSSDEICSNININNLTSRNCSMPIYAAYTNGLYINDCDILLAAELGKGNHIIYTSSNVKNIVIDNCKLNAQDKYIDFALHFYDSIRTNDSAPNVIVNNTLVKAPELMIITSYGSCEINDSHFTMIPFDNVSSQRVISFDSYNVINVNNCIFRNTQAQFIYSRDVYTNNKITINNSKIYYSLLSGANSYAMIQLSNSEADSNNEFIFNDSYIECARFIYSPANQNKNLIICNNCRIKSNAYDYFISIRNADNNIIFKDNYIEFTDTLTRLIYNGGSTLINLKLLSSYLYNINGIALDSEKTNIISLSSYRNNNLITI